MSDPHRAMADTIRGVPVSKLCPKYLHSNSTSHTSPFSAIAELIDNAYDPDVKAKQFWIDKTVVNGQECLSFMDNGNGLTFETMYKMLSFGYSDKVAGRGHVPIGTYGNGFKSGSMRLGKDAIVFSKSKSTSCVGMLSQTYLESIKADQIITPIVCFEQMEPNKSLVPHEEHKVSLQDILMYSPFSTQEELLTELGHICPPWSTEKSGTRIIIWNLRRRTSGELELDLERERYDIRLSSDVYEVTSDTPSSSRTVLTHVPDSVYSLRAYCTILYLKPRMQIIIRGQNVKSQLISKSLAHRRRDSYKPSCLKNKGIPITFGFNTKNKDQYGIMMYHRNRLIKAYERVGCQNKANGHGVGVIGIIECDYLDPTHNKQSFNDTDNYRKTMNNLGIKLEEYWKEMRYRKNKENPNSITPLEENLKPDQNWVQCDTCLKWRKLTDGIDVDKLPKKWFCHMNPDPQFRSCDVEEEPQDSDSDEPYCKTYKLQERENKKKQAQREKMEDQLTRETAALQRRHNKLIRQLCQQTSPNPTLDVPQNACSPSSNIGSPVITNVFSLSPVTSQSRGKRTQPNTPHETPKRSRVNSFNPGEGSVSVLEDKGHTDDILIIENNSTPKPIPLSKLETEMYIQRPRSKESIETFQTTGVEAANATSCGGVSSDAPSPMDLACTTTTTQTEVSRVKIEATSVQSQVKAVEGSSDQREYKHENNDDGLKPTVMKEEDAGPSSATVQQRQNGSFSLCESSEGKKYQDELLERIQTTALERDALKEKVEQLTAQLQNKKVLEMSDATVQREYNHQACQTVETEDPEDRMDYKSQLLRANQEVDKLLKENRALSAAVMESDSDEYALTIDRLMCDLQQRTNERDELRLQLEDIQEEKTNLAKECEELRLTVQQQREPNEAVPSTSSPDTLRSVVELRQNVGRILLPLVPALDLSQVNFECNVIDEILEQFLSGQDSVRSTE